MKKIVLCLAVLSLLFSCGGNNWADTEITNASDFPVTFKFNHTGEYQLLAGEKEYFETKAYQYLESYSNSKWVSFSYESTNEVYTGTFSTRDFWEIQIENTLGKDVKLSAGGWLEIDKKDTIDILAGGKVTGKIFTDNPVFNAAVVSNSDESVPVRTEWRFETHITTDDNIKNIMKVTIR